MAANIATVRQGPAPRPARRSRFRLPRSLKVRVGAGIILFFILVAIFGPLIAPHSADWQADTHSPFAMPPSARFWLGTDRQQHDILSQLLNGGRSTLLIAFVAGLIATCLSVAIGVTAGYLGGVVDEMLSILANIFLALPGLLILMVVMKPLPAGDTDNPILIGAVIALTAWAYGARVLRAQTLALRNRDYVDSARIVGERTPRIIIFEILPNLLPIVASSFIFTVIYGVGVYVVLSILGIITPAQASWGTMIQNAQGASAMISNYWWWYAPPALCVALVGIGLALLNFGIDEIVNPWARASRTRHKGVKFRLGMTPVLKSGATVPPADPADNALDVRGLCVDYGLDEEAVRAVDDAALTLCRGEVLGLAGESGSGKSTLAFAVLRLLRAPGVVTGGDVLFHSRPGGAGATSTVDLLAADATELRAVRWSQLSAVFQSAMHALNPVARIDRQLTDVLVQHRPEMTPAQRRERAVELLRLVGISADRLRSYPHELSGGMRQRIMIALALALEPQVVIMDEPTTALDVVTQREILEELMALRDRWGFAVVFITHDLSLLLEMADSIAIMYAGRIVECASAEELFRAPRHPYTVGLLRSFPALHGERVRLEGIPGSPPSLTALPGGCPFHPRCPQAMERCRSEEPPLMHPAGDGGTRVTACWLHGGVAEAAGVLTPPAEPAAAGALPGDPAGGMP
jgi:oligopeptide/dipeptide ABC transporter ATP-binding protein